MHFFSFTNHGISCVVLSNLKCNRKNRAEWFVANSEYDPYPKDNYYYDNIGIGTGTSSIEEVLKRDNNIVPPPKIVSDQATRQQIANNNMT